MLGSSGCNYQYRQLNCPAIAFKTIRNFAIETVVIITQNYEIYNGNNGASPFPRSDF